MIGKENNFMIKVSTSISMITGCYVQDKGFGKEM